MPPTPEHDPPTQQTVSPWRTFAWILCALVVAGWLTTWRLISVAESLPLGHGRDLAVAAASALHGVAGIAGFNRPAQFVAEAIGRSPSDSVGVAEVTRQLANAGERDARPASADHPGVGVTPAPSLWAATAPPSHSWDDVPPWTAYQAFGTPQLDSDENADTTARPEDAPRARPTKGDDPALLLKPVAASTATPRVIARGAASPPERDRRGTRTASPPHRATSVASPNTTKAPADDPDPRVAAGTPATSETPRRIPAPVWPGDTPPPLPTPSRTARAAAGRARASAGAAKTAAAIGLPPSASRAQTGQAGQAGRRPIYALVAGDSLAEPLGYEMRTIAEVDGLILTRLEFRISSGLARPDYFDWSEYLAEVIAEFPPDVVIWHSGGNDGQNLQADTGIATVGSARWDAEYRARVGELMDIAIAAGSRMYWLGLPPIRDDELEEAAKAMNEAARREAASRPRVSYVDLSQMFAGPDGGFTPYMAGSDGTTTRVRQEDGIHLTREGTNWVADLMYGRILADSGLDRPPTQ